METCFVCIIIHEWWRSVRRIDLNMVFQYIFFLYQKENRITKRVKKKWSWWKIRLIWNLQHLEWRYFYSLNILQIWYNCSNLITVYPTQQLQRALCFLNCPSALFFRQRNSSEIPQKNFVKLCSYEVYKM